jgi:hypothetical protein
MKAHPNGRAARRAQLLELAERLEPLRLLSKRDLPAAVTDLDALVRAH